MKQVKLDEETKLMEEKAKGRKEESRIYTAGQREKERKNERKNGRERERKREREVGRSRETFLVQSTTRTGWRL